jgi:K+-sensing histidine kinase KdpD
MAVTLNTLPQARHLLWRRATRYIGDDNALSLADLPAEHAEALRDLYWYLMEVMESVQESMSDEAPARALEKLEKRAWRAHIDHFARVFSTTGLEDRSRRKVYHDLRGGALTAAAGAVDLLRLKGDEASPDDVAMIFRALRDHVKIMRNLVRDIDPGRRDQDLTRNIHSASLLREKWSGFRSGTVTVEYQADYDGPLSSCCLEFSSTDRLVYNLVNNAVRHTADDRVRLFLKRVEEQDQPDNLQIATANRIREDEAKQLREYFDGELERLFEGGFTIGGRGVGLSICTELVGNAYGLEPPQQAVAEGYVGADIVEDEFVSWVHWPAVHDPD